LVRALVDEPATGEGRCTQSLWTATVASRVFPALNRDLGIDVAVLGAGITGLSVASRLIDEGLSVAVVDQSRIGSGVTGHTTAKRSSLHGLTYDKLIRSYDEDHARAYGEANEAGIVAWNDAERSWDCPCHGSRFSLDGNILQGPAVMPLAEREVNI
jgi:hypothetical protein